MADNKYPVWLFVVIGIVALIFLVLIFFSIKKFLRWRRNKPEAIDSIDRLGIPKAKPDDVDTLTRKCRVQIPLNADLANGKVNGAYDEEKTMTFRPTSQLGVDDEYETDPFRRLDQLGIPRARRGDSPADFEKKPPSSPLPSPTGEVDLDKDDP